MRSSPDNRGGRVVAIVLTMALVLVVTGIAVSPQFRWPTPGPTADQVALQSVRAANADLKRQLDEANAKLMEPDPPDPDPVAQARADDLAGQLAAANEKLSRPHPPDPALLAAATRPRPPVPDVVALARARDLAARNNELEAALTRPRPPVDPLADVHATLTKAQIVGSRNLFGLYTEQSPFDYGEVDLVQNAVGRNADLVGYFASWTDQFNSKPIRQAWSRGQVPLMTWEPQRQVGQITADQPEFQLSRIYGGVYDEYIRSYARGIRDGGMPVVIRLAHEANGRWYPWSEQADLTGESVNGNHVGDYTKMWRHVHDLFEQEGANDQVVWLWSPNRINRICGQRPPAAFYPGDQYVDWIGMSGYHRDYARSAGECDDISATFDGVFGPTLPLLREAAPTKPIFLSEIGATEHGDEKPEFIHSLSAGLAANPDIIGFAWFNLTVTSGTGDGRITHDWRINSSSTATAAMRECLSGLPVSHP